jgi:hypothetical protein
MSDIIFSGKLIYNPTPRCFDEELRLILLGIGGVEINEWTAKDEEETFTVVRNPWELVYLWWTLNAGWPDFEDFIQLYEHSHFTQNGKLFWRDAETIFKLEELVDGDLNAYLADHGIAAPKMPVVQKTDYRDHYGPRELEAFATRFGKEAFEHGYTF